jgi:uncharacterized protein
MLMRYIRHIANGLGLATIILPISLAAGAALAQGTAPKPEGKSNAEERYRESINSNTVTVLGASLSGAYIKIVEDIARIVNDGEKLRVLPIVGDGGSQNIRDLLYLKGVDAGIVMSTSMDSYNGKPLYGRLPNRLQYIARLYEEEFHIVGGKDISSVRDLAGKKVAFHGGAFLSGQDLLGKLKIKPAEAVKMDFFEALDKLKTGEIAAVVRATASPMQDMASKFDPAFHKLVPIPFDDSLIEAYLPGELTHKHYPTIVPDGQSVETVAIGVVLAAYAWRPGTDRYRRLAKFVDAFFSRIDKLLADKNRHPKWDDVNLAAKLPGWQRFPAAEDWLKRHGQTLPGGSAELRTNTSAPLQKPGTAGAITEKETLFREFQEWQSGRRKPAR